MLVMRHVWRQLVVGIPYADLVISETLPLPGLLGTLCCHGADGPTALGRTGLVTCSEG